jgi:hypothetical protein
MPIPDPPVVYQLCIRLAGISPLIWRRLLVTGMTSIADLHACIQTTFGWFNSHLHRFVVHGKSHDIVYSDRMSFADLLTSCASLISASGQGSASPMSTTSTPPVASAPKS